jgi:hypothetical protein
MYNYIFSSTQKEMNASCQFCYIADIEVLLQSYSHFLQAGITFACIPLNIHDIEKCFK